MSERAAEMSPQATAGPEHKRLEVFVGKWNQEGRAYDSPFGSAADISAVETFEWLTGGLFLVHRLEGQLGGVPIAASRSLATTLRARTTPRTPSTTMAKRACGDSRGATAAGVEWGVAAGRRPAARAVHGGLQRLRRCHQREVGVLAGRY